MYAKGGKLGLRDSFGWPDQLLTAEPVRADAVALVANASCLHFQDGAVQVAACNRHYAEQHWTWTRLRGPEPSTRAPELVKADHACEAAKGLGRFRTLGGCAQKCALTPGCEQCAGLGEGEAWQETSGRI